MRLSPLSHGVLLATVIAAVAVVLISAHPTSAPVVGLPQLIPARRCVAHDGLPPAEAWPTYRFLSETVCP
jgi:hypothetical protein